MHLVTPRSTFQRLICSLGSVLRRVCVYMYPQILRFRRPGLTDALHSQTSPDKKAGHSLDPQSHHDYQTSRCQWIQCRDRCHCRPRVIHLRLQQLNHWLRVWNARILRGESVRAQGPEPLSKHRASLPPERLLTPTNGYSTSPAPIPTLS